MTGKAEILILLALFIFAVTHFLFLFPKNSKNFEKYGYEIGYSATAPQVGKVRIIPLAGNNFRNVIAIEDKAEK